MEFEMIVIMIITLLLLSSLISAGVAYWKRNALFGTNIGEECDTETDKIGCKLPLKCEQSICRAPENTTCKVNENCQSPLVCDTDSMKCQPAAVVYGGGGSSGGGGSGGGGGSSGGGSSGANTPPKPPSKPTGVYETRQPNTTTMQINWASLGDNGSPSEIPSTVRLYYQETFGEDSGEVFYVPINVYTSYVVLTGLKFSREYSYYIAKDYTTYGEVRTDDYLFRT